MEAFTLSISPVQTSVEWIFGDVIKSLKALDFKSNFKIGLSTVGKKYIVCALMRNAITCTYGNQTCAYFGLEPTTVNEYFSQTASAYFSCLIIKKLKHSKILGLEPPAVNNFFSWTITVYLNVHNNKRLFVYYNMFYY